jgi:hypothetical protein
MPAMPKARPKNSPATMPTLPGKSSCACTRMAGQQRLDRVVEQVRQAQRQQDAQRGFLGGQMRRGDFGGGVFHWRWRIMKARQRRNKPDTDHR